MTCGGACDHGRELFRSMWRCSGVPTPSSSVPTRACTPTPAPAPPHPHRPTHAHAHAARPPPACPHPPTHAHAHAAPVWGVDTEKARGGGYDHGRELLRRMWGWSSGVPTPSSLVPMRARAVCFIEKKDTGYMIDQVSVIYRRVVYGWVDSRSILKGLASRFMPGVNNFLGPSVFHIAHVVGVVPH